MPKWSDSNSGLSYRDVDKESFSFISFALFFVLLVEFFVNGTGASDDESGIHSRGHLYLIMIKGVELNPPVFRDFGDNLPFVVLHAEIAIQKISFEPEGCWRLEGSQAFAFEMNFEGISEGNDSFLNPTNFFSGRSAINVVSWCQRYKLAIQLAHDLTLSTIQIHFVFSRQVQEGSSNTTEKTPRGNI